MKTLTRAGSLVAIAAMAVASQANLFSNGGFEAYSTSAADGGGIGPGYFTYNAGNAGLNDWTIGGTSVDIVTVPPGIYPIFAGNASLDLLGTPGPGSISQSITTVVGQSYDISFWAQANAAGINQTVNRSDWCGHSGDQLHRGRGHLDAIHLELRGRFHFDQYSIFQRPAEHGQRQHVH